MPDRSRRIRVTLSVLVTVALVLAAAAFYVAVSTNARNISRATVNANSAAAAAKDAAAVARDAAARAAAARQLSDQTIGDLCTLLSDIVTVHQGATEKDERMEAADAWTLYGHLKCVPPILRPPG